MKSALSLLLAGSLVLACSAPREPRVPEGLFAQADTLTLGLQKLPGAEWISVCRPEGEAYINNVLLTFFKDRYYCMWQSSPRDEDTPDSRVLCAVSGDGRTWGAPWELAAPVESAFASPGGWIPCGDTLVAVINRISSVEGVRGGSAFYVASADGSSWSAPAPLTMADGSPLEGIFEQDPKRLPGGGFVGAAHFGQELALCPLYTGDPKGVSGWSRALFPAGEGKPLEPSQYRTRDGSLVLFCRDQASSFRKLYSVSRDGGRNWSAPAVSNIPDSRSKQCAGNLPDGSAFWVANPTGNKSRRILVLALSRDGYLFDRAFLLAGPADLPAKRHEGRYKTLGYSYPKATVIGADLWVSFSVNKEEAALVRIPINALNNK